MPLRVGNRWLALVLMGCVTLAPSARACNVPVFRYALEKWKPSQYEALVFHRGPLSAEHQALVNKLESNKSANLTLTTVDLAGTPTKQQEAIWQLHGDRSSLPRVIVHYPGDNEKAPPAWAGPLDDVSTRLLLDSPARRRLIQLLTKGESAVWVLLESGDKSADDAAADLVTRELKRLQSAIKLPVQEEADKLESSLPLRLSFTLLRVARADDESAFVRLLLGSDEDLVKVKGPVVFPVIGRGRMLVGLHGPQLKPATIERWASFLCGGCSCQVKELNPGVDLLLTADWQRLLDTAEEEPVRITVSAPTIPPGGVAEPKAEEGVPKSGKGVLWGALVATVVVLLLAGVMARRGGDRSA